MFVVIELEFSNQTPVSFVISKAWTRNQQTSFVVLDSAEYAVPWFRDHERSWLGHF